MSKIHWQKHFGMSAGDVPLGCNDLYCLGDDTSHPGLLDMQTSYQVAAAMIATGSSSFHMVEFEVERMDAQMVRPCRVKRHWLLQKCRSESSRKKNVSGRWFRR